MYEVIRIYCVLDNYFTNVEAAEEAVERYFYEEDIRIWYAIVKSEEKESVLATTEAVPGHVFAFGCNNKKITLDVCVGLNKEYETFGDFLKIDGGFAK